MLALLALLTVAQPRPSDGPPDLVEKAYRAAEQKRYCDAIPLFLSLHERAPQAKHLYRAAEVAYAAGDYRLALDLYRSVRDAYPTFEKKKVVEERIATLTRVVKERGPGVECPEVPAVCGDWIIRPGEQCDDGNMVDGDGCDSNCTLSSCGNAIVTAPEQCDDGNVIDGDGCDGNCMPTSCGNGIVTAGEECDDGNLKDGDGCDAGCVLTRCGNGILTDGEQCDDGNNDSGDGCDRNCMQSMCGNGARSDDEECDDGNDVDGDGCDHDCTATRCGNDIVTQGEQCDDGNNNDGDGCDHNCTLTACGNGVRTSGEQCDDGNNDDGDACDAQCHGGDGTRRIFGGGLAFTGSAIAVVGVAIGFTGIVPVLDHAAAANRLEEAEARADDDPTGALADARNLQVQMDEANRRWREFGVPLVVGGLASLVAGTALAAWGVYMWADEEPAPPAQNPDDEERVP